MKKLIAILLAIVTVLAFAACGNKTESNDANNSVGHILLNDFKERAESDDIMSIAEGLLENEVIQFMGGAMSVEPGFLTGFGDTEITGFEEGVMFSPMIGTIPFVGYVFTLSDESESTEFIATLEGAADLRWNICTEADEMVTGSAGNKVFFVMCPTEFDEAE